MIDKMNDEPEQENSDKMKDLIPLKFLSFYFFINIEKII